LARAETAASAAFLAAVSAFADVATMLWHCIMSRLVGTAQSLVFAGCARLCGATVVPDGTAAAVVPDGDVAARAGLALASPGSVNAATVRHAPTVAYNFERKMYSPVYEDAGSRPRPSVSPRARTQESSHLGRAIESQFMPQFSDFWQKYGKRLH
jgi:hypothetical protein